MGNTSKKRRNKRLWTGGIIAVLALLVISFVVSKSDDTIDPTTFANVETYPIAAHEKGNLESEIRLIEYSDFQCPACKSAAPAIEGFVEEFGDQFVLEYRHFPLKQIHPNAVIAAKAAEAAGIQGKFWEMHDILFENQAEWSESFNPERYLRNYAVEIGLNEDLFRIDLDSDEVAERVENDSAEALILELPGTPSFVFNGEIVNINEFISENLELTDA